MNRSAAGSWSLRLGRWRGVEVRLHLHFALLALGVLLVASLRPELSPIVAPFSTRAALAGLGILLASVVLHEAARALVAQRVGGHTHLIVLGPTGGWTQPHLPADPPAHLVTAVVGPLAYLAILVSAACALAIAGDTNLLPLFSLFSPTFDASAPTLHWAAQVTVWINTWLLLVNLLPIQPCDGAEVLRGILWPLVGRASAAMAASHIAYGAAAVTAAVAILVHQQMLNQFIPQWFPLAVVSVLLLYGGNRAARQRQYDLGLDIDLWESDDEWLTPDVLEDDRAAVLVEHLQQKQQDALDRKRREREDREDERVDDILARLQDVGFEKLSEEEQAILKRASRRYRQRQQRIEGA